MISLRQRLVLLHLLVLLLAIGGTAAASWWVLSRSVNQQLDAALLSLAEAEASMLADGAGGPVRIHEAPDGSAPPSLARLDRLIQIVDGEGRILARSANLGSEKLPVDAALLAKMAQGETVFLTLPDTNEEPLRMVSVPTLAHSVRYAVQVAGSMDDANHIVQSASMLFVGMAAALLAVVGWAGAQLSRKLFVAIENIVSQARVIEDGNLHRRLPHPGSDDEIGHLVHTLNAMLERIERAFDVQRRFTADASHELRSPLSRLRAEIEITLRRPRSNEEYVSTLRSCLEEVDGLTTLVEELLMLARLDGGQQRAPAELLPVIHLASEAVRRMQAVAQVRGIELLLIDQLGADVLADAGPLNLVLRNILDNAIKFSPDGGRVTVCASHDGQQTILIIQDEGPGLETAEIPFVFDRFFRGSRTRAGEVEGYGLGLALSYAIMHACGGKIEAANLATGGASFKVTLP